MYVFGGGGRHHSEFGWELEVRVLRKEVLWSERGGCLSGKRGSCPADVVEAVTIGPSILGRLRFCGAAACLVSMI